MSIENMKKRLEYLGGKSQLARMNADKLKSLKKALLYSYQAATAILSDGREFRCLINSDKINLDADNKIISIPFKDVCIGGSGNISPSIEDSTNQDDEGYWENMEDLIATLVYSLEDTWEDMVPEDDVNDVPDPEEDISAPIGEIVETGIKEGDIITWKENGSHWLVYLRRLEETAYFRANMRRCRYQLTLGNGSVYWAYVRGPVEQNITWSQINNNYFNKLNYSLVMYITQNEETLKYFHRFKRIIVNNQSWEVQTVDSISTPGILEISLKETYSNTIENDPQKAVKEAIKQQKFTEEKTDIYIYGADKIYPYEVHSYELKNYKGKGTWIIENASRKNLVKIQENNSISVEILVTTGKSGNFTLSYIEDNVRLTSLNINIGSL